MEPAPGRLRHVHAFVNPANRDEGTDSLATEAHQALAAERRAPRLAPRKNPQDWGA